MNIPLAERMRPKNLDEYIAQNHLVGNTGALRRALEAKSLPSIILWGTPGVGKTTLARILAETSGKNFYALSALHAGVKEVREVIEKAKNQNLFSTEQPLVFIDEIHRFNKSQQDSLLEAVEKGWITFMGATTENPSFEVIPALLSRCQVYHLEAFTKEELITILKNAIIHDTILQKKKIILKETEALLRFSGGDARKLLNALELVASTHPTEITITNELVLEHIQQNIALYDKTGEQHYDIISAFIKSIRGSDPHATVYWLARMIEGGEEVKFIARRMIISASEDIGLANPTALIMATNCFQAVSVVGYPESRIILSQCAIYLATSPKSNSAYKAIAEAQQVVKQTGDLSVPLHLRNAPTQLMKKMNYGKDYLYSHDYPEHFIYQEFMPAELSHTPLYKPADNQKEQQIDGTLKRHWKNKY